METRGLRKGSSLCLFVILVLVVAVSSCAPAAPAPTPTVASKPAATTAPAPAAPTTAPVATAKPAPAAAPAAPAAPAPVAPAPLNPPVTVNVGIVGTLTDAPTLIGIDRGYFKEQGLNLNVVPFVGGGTPMMPAIATGQVDVGSGANGAGLFNAVGRDVKITIVADKAATNSNSILVRKDLIDSGAVKTYADLKGRKFGQSGTGNAQSVALDMAMKSVGLRYEDLNTVTIDFPDMNPAMANKNIDAALSSEPFSAQGVDQGIAVRWKKHEEYYPGQQVAVIMYSPQFAKDKPEAAKRYMVGYVKGLRDFYNAFVLKKDKPAVVNILTKTLAIKDPALYDKMLMFEVNPDGYVNLKTLQQDLDWYVDRGLVKEKLDVGPMVDHSFVDFAVKTLGKFQQ